MDNEVTMYTVDGLDILYHSGMISEEEYLAHHGILGQKWGVRRYQNADGSLTDEGRKKYGVKSNYYKNKNIKSLVAAGATAGIGGTVKGVADYVSNMANKKAQNLRNKSVISKTAAESFRQMANNLEKSSRQVVDKETENLETAKQWIEGFKEAEQEYKGHIFGDLARIKRYEAEDEADQIAEKLAKATEQYEANVTKGSYMYKAAVERTDMANMAANAAKGAAAVASLASGIGSVAIVSSAAISAAQLGYAIYNKYKQKQAEKTESDEKQKKKH